MGADVTTTGIRIEGADNLGAEISWTGTPTGTLKFQGSNSSTNGTDGNWYDLSVTFGSQPAGSASGLLIDLNQVPFKFVRLVYTRSSGTGALTAIILGKTL
jgi:hypothetical protein